MPIKGLTTGNTGAFPKLGVLRKGGPKAGNRPGTDLDYFRFDTQDAAAAQAFRAAYGEQPREIHVCLPFNTLDENWSAWREEWTASSLIHRCDGETCAVWLDPKTQKYHTTPKPCPYANLPDGDAGRQCKPVGRLAVVIPELRRMALVTVQTTSKYDIIEITRNLQATMQIAALIGRGLQGIPFRLTRRERDVSTPMGNGQRRRVKKWLLAIEADPVWASTLIAAANQLSMSNDARVLALPAPSGQAPEIVDVSSGEVIAPAGPAQHAPDGWDDDDDDEAGGASQPAEASYPAPVTAPAPTPAPAPAAAPVAQLTPERHARMAAAYDALLKEAWALKIDGEFLPKALKLPAPPAALLRPTPRMLDVASQDLEFCGRSLKVIVTKAKEGASLDDLTTAAENIRGILDDQRWRAQEAA